MIAKAWRRRPRAAASCRRGRAGCSRRSRPPPGFTLAVGWGPPLEPFALEAIETSSRRWVSRSSPCASAATRRCLKAPTDCSSPASWTRRRCRRSPPTTPLKTNLAAAIDGGLPTLALGGGALLLLRRLADSRGRTHELAGVLPAEAELLEWYERPRYVRANKAARENRYVEGETTLYELFDLEFLTLQQEAFAWRVGEAGEEGQVEGFVHERCLATTLVPSLPATPAWPPASSPRCGWRRRASELRGAGVLAAHTTRPAHPLAGDDRQPWPWSPC